MVLSCIIQTIDIFKSCFICMSVRSLIFLFYYKRVESEHVYWKKNDITSLTHFFTEILENFSYEY